LNTLLFTLSLSLGVLVGVLILYRRAERARAKRSVEPPNSTFQSRYVQELRSWERWEKMDLSRLHEINRAEVEKLLSKVRRASVRVLTVQERDFLERMADAHDRVAGKEFRGGAGGARPSPASGMP
jgi:hypothetical protein